MIRTLTALRAVLAAGRTVSRQLRFDGAGFWLATSDDSHAVSEAALRRLEARGEAFATRRDLFGEPMEWASKPPPPRNLGRGGRSSR